MEIIVSQVGYDIGKSKKAFVADPPENGKFCLINAVTKQTELEGTLR